MPSPGRPLAMSRISWRAGRSALTVPALSRLEDDRASMNFTRDPQPLSEQRIVRVFVDGTGFSIEGFKADEPSSLVIAIRDFYKVHGLREPKITAVLGERKIRVVDNRSLIDDPEAERDFAEFVAIDLDMELEDLR